jgi:hypothetical protein
MKEIRHCEKIWHLPLMVRQNGLDRPSPSYLWKGCGVEVGEENEEWEGVEGVLRLQRIARAAYFRGHGSLKWVSSLSGRGGGPIQSFRNENSYRKKKRVYSIVWYL